MLLALKLRFSFFSFSSLVKDYKLRPNYMRLLEHPFIVAHADAPNDAFADFINANLPPPPQ